VPDVPRRDQGGCATGDVIRYRTSEEAQRVSQKWKKHWGSFLTKPKFKESNQIKEAFTPILRPLVALVAGPRPKGVKFA
jgi:hypothetical protein